MVLRILKMVATSGFLATLRVHQIRFRLGLCSGPHWGILQRSPDPLAGLRDPDSKANGSGGRGKGRGEEGGMKR